MDQDGASHRKIRFKRRDIKALKKFPSAKGRAHRVLRRPRLARLIRWSLSAVVGFAVILAILVLGIQMLGGSAVGQDRLRLEAQKALTALAGFEVRADMQDLRLVLSDRSLVALEVRELDLSQAETGKMLIKAEALRFGFRLLPLLRGKVEIGSAEIEGARINVENLSSRRSEETDTPFWMRPIEPRSLQGQFFDGLRRVYALTERTGTRYITLRDVEVMTGGEAGRSVRVDLQASVGRTGKLAFEGELALGERSVTLQGEAQRPSPGGPISSLLVEVDLPRNHLFPLKLARQTDGNAPRNRLDQMTLGLTGSETEIGKGELAFDIAFKGLTVDLREDGVITGDGQISARVVEDAEAIAIRRANLVIGRSEYDFNGSLGLIESDADGRPVYGFDLVSRKSTVAAEDVQEGEVPFAARMSGRIEAASGRIIGETIRIVTGTGQISASASVTLEAGKSPGLSLAVYASDLPTAEVKQFWPWFAATGARNWVVANLFGGRVTEGNLRLRVPPGRLGDGHPLRDDEVSGEFKVSGARFDIAGTIPPVRDGIGMVAFQGVDVDVSIESGTVYMPSGRTVAASNGTLAIRNANVKPRIGKLGIDVAGDAPAVVELASYEPIDVSSVLDLSPGDVTGTVKGHVIADIPLSDGIPRDRLGWRVQIDYENLSIAKPFDGQSVTEARGTATIEPQRAEISAAARLNGVPARLELVEPLGKAVGGRQRKISLTLDDATRKRMIPGLEDILSGPTEVGYEDLGEGRRKISVKLDAAQLSLPWVNWRKGAGIPGSATFVMEEKNGETSLSDFVLQGQTFGARGRLTIANGSLMSARFDSARLNRGDDFAVSVDRRGKSYAVSIKGDAFDARSVIKYYLGKGGQSSAGDDAGSGSGLELTASLSAVSGFNSEVLRAVTLTYASAGNAPGRLKAGATTRAGGKITLSRGDGAVDATSTDAGAIMRFLDFYANMEGGQMRLALSEAGRVLSGSVAAQDFFIVNEPRLRSLVAATETGPGTGTGTGTGDAKVDATRVRFERGFSNIRKTGGSLDLTNGVLRGPLIGTTFQGQLFDANNNVSITGTFMPLYGINRIFGEIPLFGNILGNGRDRGLIGITYRLYGNLDAPQLDVNPISAIAPGIFRQIFEYR